jgi:hypothetical protein
MNNGEIQNPRNCNAHRATFGIIDIIVFRCWTEEFENFVEYLGQRGIWLWCRL